MRLATMLRHQLPAACVLLGVSALTLVAPSASSAASPGQLVRTAMVDAEARGSVHQTLTDVLGNVQASYVSDVAGRKGRQLISFSNGIRAEVLVSGNDAFITGNAKGLTDFFGFPSKNARAVGKDWVGIPSAYKEYATVAYAVTLPSALAEVTPAGHLRQRNGTFQGDAVTEISGKSALGTGVVTLYVSDGKRPLPVYAKFSATQAGNKSSGTTTFSDWGERVTVVVPTYSLPLTELSVAISGSGGYKTFDGPNGYPLAVGRPWGKSCKPIVFEPDRKNLPTWAYPQIATVVRQARSAGLDVTWEGRSSTWKHQSLYYRHGQSPKTVAVVVISGTTATPAKLPTGKPEHVALGWSAKLDPDGSAKEQLTRAGGTLWLHVLSGHPELLRRAIRQLVGVTQGVDTPTTAVSGMSDASTTDHFTSADISAMLKMSGCSKPAASGISGIAD